MPIEDTGDGGQWVWAYTAQMGNGLSATISAEQRRDTQILGNTAGVLVGGGVLTGVAIGEGGGYGGEQAPDVVGNLRIDQVWGSAQVMGALHEVNANYYNPTAINGQGFGNPSATWGFVVGAGLRLNFPMIAQGDYFQGEVNYTRGALRYLNQPNQGNYEAAQSNTAAFGIMSDCVYGAPTAGSPVGGSGCNLTSAWSVNAAYEHYWTPSVHESFVGAYEAVSYGGQGNALLCNLEGDGSFTTPLAGCNNNWSVWGVSSRLQWDVTKSFYLGVEVMYNHLNSATTSSGLASGGSFAAPAGPPFTIGGAAENAYNVTVRMHKDFLP